MYLYPEPSILKPSHTLQTPNLNSPLPIPRTAAICSVQRVTSPKATLPRVAGRAVRLTVEANKRIAKKATVVLTMSDPKLGQAGDIVEVALGYWRNHLEPMGKAKKVGG